MRDRRRAATTPACAPLHPGCEAVPHPPPYARTSGCWFVNGTEPMDVSKLAGGIADVETADKVMVRAKGERADISQADRNELRSILSRAPEAYREGVRRHVEGG